MQVGDSDEGLTGCRCNSQQGTRLDVSFRFCMSVVQNGYFDDTKPDPEPPQAPMHAASPPPVFEQAIASGLQSAPKGSSVVVVPYEKGKFLW